MMRKAIVFALFLGLVCLLPAQTGRGQGRIHGVVLDTDGRPIEGALVVATHLASGTTFKTRTDRNGAWALLGLGTGEWKVTASKKGYVSATVTVYVRQLRKNPPIEFRLPRGIESIAKELKEEKIKRLSGLLEEGNNLFQQGKYLEAAEKFREILKEAPELYQIKINVANCYLKAGDYDKAIEFYQKALEDIKKKGGLESDRRAASRALSGLGEAWLGKGDLQKAFQYFKKSVELLPEDEVAAYNVGVILFNNMKTEEAIKYFQLAVKIKPDWPKPYKKLGYAYINKGDYARALEAFKKYLELNPQAPDKSEVLSVMEELKKLAGK